MSEKDTHNKVDSAINRRNYLKLASMAGTGLGTGVGVGAVGTEFTTHGRAATTIVDDFSYSSGGLSDRYKFDQDGGNATVTSASTVASSDDDSNVLEVSGGNSILHAFQGDGDTDLNAYPSIGDTFSCWIRGVDGTGIMNFSYGAQDKDNKYYVQLNLDSAHLGLFKYVSGSGQSLTGDWSNSTIQSNSGWFKVEIQWTTDHTHTVTLYQNGNQVTSFSYTEDSSDPQFTATGVGYSAYLGSGETAQFDYATTTGSSDSGSGSGTVYNKSNIDAFERAGQELDSYRFDRGESGAELVTDSESTGTQVHGPTYSGVQALKISDSSATEMISLPGDGLPNYPEAGDNITCYLKASGGADNFNFSWGVQGHQDRYYVKVKPESDNMYLFKYKNADGTVLASTSGLSMSQDSWYWLEINWATDGTQTVELYDLEGNVLAECTGTDAEWSTGGVGFDAYLNSGETIYFDECVVVEEEGPHQGGWGPIAVPSYGQCCPSATTEDGTWYNVNDFMFYMSYDGFFSNEDDNTVIHDFQVSGTFHTYEVAKPFTSDSTADELRPHYKQYDTKVRAEVSDHASISAANDDYTWAYGLGGTEWENWKNDESNHTATTPSLDDFKAAAEDHGVVGDAGSVNDFFLEGLWFAATVIIGRADPRAAFTLELIDYLSSFGTNPEPNCTYETDDAVGDLELSEWYWCDPPVGLVSVSRSLRVEVPRGSGSATVTVKQLVGGDGNPQDHFLTENLCEWDITCPDEERNASWSATKKLGDF